MKGRNPAIAALLALALPLAGCGYHLAGHSRSLPPEVKRIGIPIFVNKTERPELEQRITARVISEFVTRGRYQISSNEEGVDAILKGEILVYLLNPVAIDAEGRATRYEIILNARAALVATADDRVLWQDDHFVFRQQYDVSQVSAGIVTEERVALDQVADGFATALVTSILEGF